MIETIQLQITGMTCAACSARIEKVVGRMPGVQTVSVSLPLGQASVRLDGKVVRPEQIKGKIEEIGYGAKEELEDARTANRSEIRSYRNRFVLSAMLSFPLLWAMLAHFPPTSVLPVPPLFVSPWFQLALATLLQLYVAYPFYQGAYRAIRARTANMDVLVALGTSISYLYSHRLLFVPADGGETAHGHLYFDTAAMILTSVLLGKLLESIAKGRALKEMGALQSLQARMIRTEGPSGEEWIPAESAAAGMIAVVMPGELMPADGRVVSGRTEVDESFLTGESRLVAKAAGDAVFAGARNLSGAVRVRMSAAGGNTRLAGMIRLVEEAQHSKPVIQRKVDRIAAVAIPVMILCAVAAYIYWALRPDAGEGEALRSAMAVLLVSCPCALGLAAPISILIASGLSAKRGILFKEGRSIERLHQVDRIVLDKTGTLTEGKPSIRAIESPGHPETYVLRLAAALEKKSGHPIALAIAAEAAKRRLLVPEADETKESPGHGVTGIVEGRWAAVGSSGWLRKLGIAVPERADRGKEEEGSVLHVALDGRWIASIAWTDRLRSESEKAVRELSAYGELWMLTGDEEEAAKRIAAEAGISRYRARMLPENKLEVVRNLQAEGRTVAMIGDGANDAAALAAADVGMVMDSGTAAAIEAGDVVLLKGELTKAAQAITISRLTMRNIRQNLGFSLAYNGVMIPFAASGWLDPRVACLSMALSSVIVVCNSLRLTRQLGGTRRADERLA